MATYVTIHEVNDQLRLGLEVYDAAGDPIDAEDITDPDKNRITRAMDRAEAIVLDYIANSTDFLEGTSPPVWSTSPPDYSEAEQAIIKEAIMLVIAATLDDADKRTLADYMTPQVGAVPLVLMRLRRPTLA